jgi:hypothetical protein
VLTLAAWALGRPLGRYLLPALALAAAGTGAAWITVLDRLPVAARRIAWAVLVIALTANINPARTGYAVDRIACTLGSELEARMLNRYVGCYPAIQVCNTALPETAVVHLVGEARSFGLDRQVVVEDPFSVPLLVEKAEVADGPEAIAQQLRAMGITHLLVNWREAQRVARMNGRQRYLQCHDPEAERILDDFLEHALIPVWQQGDLQVLALR